MGFVSLAALIIVIVAVVLIIQKWDVRLILLAAALIISAIAGDMPRVLREFLATFSNEKFVVPICTAMGFAYVLKFTECDRHLVQLLVKPLEYVRGLLIPGVIVVGFLVNIPVISQTSTAVCIGPVVLPLMRAAGYCHPTTGACLLLGVSVGGELLNPGAPELLTVFDKTGVSTKVQAQEYLPPLVFTQLAVSMLVFWLMSVWWERKAAAQHEPTPDAAPSDIPHLKINLVKALVPVVPLVFLFASGPPLNLFNIPDEWVVLPQADGKRSPAYSSRLIGLAMMLGVLVAMVVSPAKARECVRQFFEGAGYGFTHIISLIVTANCFGKAIELAGFAQLLGQLITETPRLMQPLAALVPMLFGAVSGSGMASTQSLYSFFYNPAVALGLDPVRIGALVSLGAAAGRTMSPVAAVVLMCAALTQSNPFTLAKRVALPLIIGLTVVVCLRMARIL